MKGRILFVLFCVKIALAADSFEESTTNIALSVYGECSSNTEDLYVCLKKKAFTLLDRLGRSQNFSISDSVKLVRTANPAPTQEEEISERKLDELLPRSLDAKNAALTKMLSNKIAEFFGSRTLEIALPRSLSDDVDNDNADVTDEARFGGGGLKKKGKKKKKGGSGIILLIGAKILMIKSLLIAALFFLVKKALIISKVALLLSGFIAIKKLLFAKSRGSGGAVTHVYAEPAGHSESHVVHDGGWSSGGNGGGGWSSGVQGSGWSGAGGQGSGWDKRSIDAQNLAYNAYAKNQ